MATVPHPVPSRTAHNIAALYGDDDDTLIAWQRFCAQAAEPLRPQHDPERLSKALALAQGGHVEVEDDGFAVVTSGTTLYHVQADGTCDCPDFQNRRTSCKHGLAVLIHTRAQELAAQARALPRQADPPPQRSRLQPEGARRDPRERPPATTPRPRYFPRSGQAPQDGGGERLRGCARGDPPHQPRRAAPAARGVAVGRAHEPGARHFPAAGGLAVRPAGRRTADASVIPGAG